MCLFSKICLVFCLPQSHLSITKFPLPLDLRIRIWEGREAVGLARLDTLLHPVTQMWH